MRLKKLVLSNFRSFGAEPETITFEDFTVLIGGNSTGKTAVMQALAKLFSPDSRERGLQRSDFHLAKGERPETMPEKTLFIEAVFEFPELDSDNNPLAEKTVPGVFNQMAVAGEDGRLYLRVRLTATWSPSDAHPDGEIDDRVEFVKVAESVTDDSQHRQELRGSERGHIQLVYVPAIRDPLAQLRHQSGALLWRLLNAIKWSDELKGKVKTGAEGINQLFGSEVGFKSVQNIMQSQWQLYHEDKRYQDISVGFSSEELTEVLKRVELRFRPTVEEKAYTVDQLGDGLRSLFYLSLVSSVLQLEERLQNERTATGAGFARENYTPPALTILAIEEPENHLSPQLLGRVVENLTKTAQQSNADVILSTHTPAMLRRVGPEQIRHLRMQPIQQRTVVRTIKLPEKTVDAHKYVKEAVMAYPELYFARLVVLGEGDSEELVIPRLLRAFGYSLDRTQVAMVPLGGRHVNHFWRLLTDLQIPHVTLLDLDRERDGGGWGRVKYVLQQLLDNGADPSELLRTSDGNLADLDNMHTWKSSSIEFMDSWITYLEKKGNVFFSYPLDLDFAMLSAFPDEYKSAFGPKTGPVIPDKTTKKEAYQKRLEKVIRGVFKDEGGDGETYKDYDEELFFWYNYLFLGRGKPTSHIAALTAIEEDALRGNAPPSLTRLCKKIGKMLEKGE